MANLNGFDANQVDPTFGFDPIPAGDYLAIITESAFKDTKSGSGKFLEVKFEVIDGPHKGRNLWARLNLDNANETAVKIAKAELSAICRAVGVLQPKDSCDLHNLPLTLTVKCRKREDNGEITNEIKGYRPKGAPPAADAPAPTAEPAPATANVAADNAPWMQPR